MGYDFTGGRISHFPIDFCMGLTTVQRKGAACDDKPCFVRNRTMAVGSAYNVNVMLMSDAGVKYAIWTSFASLVYNVLGF